MPQAILKLRELAHISFTQVKTAQHLGKEILVLWLPKFYQGVRGQNQKFQNGIRKLQIPVTFQQGTECIFDKPNSYLSRETVNRQWADINKVEVDLMLQPINALLIQIRVNFPPDIQQRSENLSRN